ncbi:MAG: DUF6499 domain-containing protein [Candidatus Thermoplasmatota archaeon]|nr:DUF6499 domain-containing protein [Candidatus Thermoplasmatota archaeon]
MDADPYAYCAGLTRDQWAWEFLRRNPEYQRDFQAFIAIWRALEANYGAPPNRDFSRWKQDPRAYGPLPGDAKLAAPTGELCTVDDDRVLLECWMGAKWGFHKFPLDPERIAPAPDELSWRLPPQLEDAKFRLVSRAAELRRQGLAAPKTVANQRARWTTMLRLLDGGEARDANRTELLDEGRILAYHGRPPGSAGNESLPDTGVHRGNSET